MNNQDLMDIRKQCVDGIVKVNDTPLAKEQKEDPKAIKGDSKTTKADKKAPKAPKSPKGNFRDKEIAKRAGYVLALQDVIKMIDTKRSR